MGAAGIGLVLTCPRLVDADKHEVAATPKNGRVGRLVLDRPALRDPTADGTVEATLTLLA